MAKQVKRDVIRAATVKETATVVGVSTRQVNRVLSMDRENETVVDVYMFLKEGKEVLIEEAKKLAPAKKEPVNKTKKK